MEILATYTFNASPSRVWDLLMDTGAIATCLPGCRELRPVGTDRYETELVAGVAAISGSFKATLTLEDKQPPRSYTLNVDATGRPGFVQGKSVVTLTGDDGTTAVQIAVSADVGGTIARVGQRLLEGVARMTMDRFYACLAKRLESSPKPE